MNKISKNFDNVHNFNHVKKDYLDLLTFYNKLDSINELTALTDCKTMSSKLKEDLVSSWAMYMSRRYNVIRPEPDKRILFVKFKDILYNDSKVLNSIATFINSEVNETSVMFYKQYLETSNRTKGARFYAQETTIRTWKARLDARETSIKTCKARFCYAHNFSEAPCWWEAHPAKTYRETCKPTLS